MKIGLVALSSAVMLVMLAPTAVLAQVAVPEQAPSEEKDRAKEAVQTVEEREAEARDCEDVSTEMGAQALFELDKEDRFGLDKDGDGVACENAPGGAAEDGTKIGTKTGGDQDCVDFCHQKAAQAALETKPSDPYKLDPENNGVACEIRPADYGDPATDLEPVAAARSDADLDCKDFEYRQEAMMVYFRDQGDPNSLSNGQGAGTVCPDLPVLVSNGEGVIGVPAGEEESASAPLALLKAWPHGGSVGLVLDSVALLLVASGLIVLRHWRRPAERA